MLILIAAYIIKIEIYIIFIIYYNTPYLLSDINIRFAILWILK